MATKADEHEPEWRVIERIIQVVLQPNLLTCEEALGSSMTGRLTVWVRDEPRSSWVITYSAIDPPGAEPVGDVRLRCRRTYRPERSLFRVESVYPGLNRETGFSGFSVSGDLLVNQDEVIVRPATWTGQYHVRTWHGWV
jgi:hypothetical protein